MNTARGQKFFKISRAAEILGLSAETLRRWERAGRISFPRTPGGKRLFSEDDLEAIRKILNQPQKPTHSLLLVQAHKPILEPTHQISTPSQSIKTYTPVSHKKQTSIGKLFNLFVYLAFFAMILSNAPAFNPPDLQVLTNKIHEARGPLSQNLNEAKKSVLGIETALIPAAQEGSALAQTYLTRIVSFFKSISFPSFRFPFLAFFVDNPETEIVLQEDLTLRIEALEESVKALSLSSPSGESISSSLTLFSLTTTTLLATTINTNTFDGSKLVFSGNSPSIYPSTSNTSISLNASGTGAINIGNAGTGDIYLAGGSGDSGCTINNNNGTLNCSSNITSAGDLIANGGDILTDKATLNLGGSSTTIAVLGNLSITGTSTFTGAGSFIGNINSDDGALQTNGVTRIDNSGNLTAGTGSFSGNVLPGLDATYNFGSESVRWLNGYFSGDVVVGDAVFKNDFRLTEGLRSGKHSIDMLNPRGEMIASFDENGNFWVKGEIKQYNGN